MFWNLNKKPRHGVLARLLKEKGVDVLMLAECPYEPSELLGHISRESGLKYHFARSPGCERIRIFTRFSDNFFSPRHEKNTFTVRTLTLPEKTPLILAVAHLPSKLHWDTDDQAAECQRLGDRIRQLENEEGHENSVLVGDLNMNPFEAGVVSASGFHGVMSRSVAKKGSRRVQEETYPFFYNPMWGLYGENTPGPAGTYYYQGSQHMVYFWNIFDQVLVRPTLLERFDDENLEVVTEIEGTSFLSPRGLPDASVASDHLPVLFRLKL